MSTTIITIGRFQPATIGHSLLFKRMLQAKSYFKSNKALIYTTHSQDPKKNPLSYDDKIKFLKALVNEKYPGIEVINSPARNVIEALIELDGTTDNIVLIIGQDRLSEFQNLLNKYNGKEYNYKSIKVISAGDRDPDSDTTSGMSASKLRQAVRDGDFNSFRKGIDSFNDNLIKSIWVALKKGMRLKETTSIRDAYTLRELREYCRLREEGEIEDNKPGDEFLARVKSLYDQANIPFENNIENKEDGLQVQMTQEAADILSKRQTKELNEYTGSIGVLLIDEIIGTKFLSDYIGKYYKLVENLAQTNGENFEGLLVAIRILRGDDDPIQQSSLLGAVIAWGSDIGNPTFLKQSSNMRVTFDLYDTVDLFINCSAKKMYIDAISNILTYEKLGSTITEINEKQQIDTSKLDYNSLRRPKQKAGMTEAGNLVRGKESEADKKIEEFAQLGKNAKRSDFDNFVKAYGIDKRILATRLNVNKARSLSKQEKDNLNTGQYEAAFKEIGDVLGITPLFRILDKIEAKEMEKKLEPQKATPQ